MSRIVVYGLDNLPVGEFTGIVNRSWAINDANSTTVTVSGNDIAEKPFIQMGRVVVIYHDKLPEWVGVIDAPISCLYKASLALYSIEYLLSLRMPLDKWSWTSNKTDNVIAYMIKLVNDQQDTYFRPGVFNPYINDTYNVGSFSADNYWNQIKGYAKSRHYEIFTRVARVNSQLIYYLDTYAYGLYGTDCTEILLHDGDGGNVELKDISVSEAPINLLKYYVGTSIESASYVSNIYKDDRSVSDYRLRSSLMQTDSITSISALNNFAIAALAKYKVPKVTTTLNILDVGDILSFIKLGNTFSIRITNCVFPGGKTGYRGRGRIEMMTYNELTNNVTVSFGGIL